MSGMDYYGGWSQGWKDALFKFDIILTREKQLLEARLRLNREDFNEDHPAVSYLEEQIAWINRMQREILNEN